MKFVFSIILLICFLSMQAQKHFEACITFNTEFKFLSERDSIYTDSLVKANGTVFRNLIIVPSKEILSLKKDSVLICDYIEDTIPKNIYLSTKDIYQTLDMNSGVILDRKDYTPSKYQNLNKYKRIADEDEEICGYKCKAWILKSKNQWRKIWITKVDGVLPNTVKSGITIDDKLILKEVQNNSSRRITKHAVEICDLSVANFSELIKKNATEDINSKYEPISENTALINEPVKIGQIAPDIYYRQVFQDDITNLYQTTQKSNYTMIEFWGTWCIPCLAATHKIKILRDKFSEEQLSIISFNTRDKIEEKVKGLIKKKDMNWQHAYSTKKIISIYNEKGRYPTAVLINKNNEVILIGNPHEILDEVEKIVLGELSVKE